MTNQLHLSASRLDATTSVLAVAGEIDLAVAQDLRDATATALRGRGLRRLVIDFAGVTFLDCSGISVLLAATNTAHAQDVDAVLINCSPLVLRILEITGVTAALLG